MRKITAAALNIQQFLKMWITIRFLGTKTQRVCKMPTFFTEIFTCSRIKQSFLQITAYENFRNLSGYIAFEH